MGITLLNLGRRGKKEAEDYFLVLNWSHRVPIASLNTLWLPRHITGEIKNIVFLATVRVILPSLMNSTQYLAHILFVMMNSISSMNTYIKVLAHSSFSPAII